MLATLTATTLFIPIDRAQADVIGAVTISGILTDEEGNPATGVQIWADGGAKSLTTNLDGHFSYTTISAEDRLSFTLEWGNGTTFRRVITEPFSITGDTDLGSLVLPPTQPVAVRVVDNQGDPLEGVQVRGPHSFVISAPTWVDAGFEMSSLVRTSEMRWDLVETTDENGYARFLAPRTTTGLPEIYVDYQDPDSQVWLRATLEAGEQPSEELELRLPAPARVSGTLVDSSGQPMGGVLMGQTATSDIFTDTEGRFTYDTAAGEHQLMLRFEFNYGETTREIISAPFSVDGHTNLGTLVVPPTEPVAIRVVDNNGLPVTGARVHGVVFRGQLTAPEWIDGGFEMSPEVKTDMVRWRLQTTTDENGYARFLAPRTTTGLPEIYVDYQDPDSQVWLRATLEAGEQPS
ncbi:hypothetical protein, partial [Tessaracoccus sp. MC1756]|uniref:hypothetical protein n=1 Tax=Tessaracoccus sp. MC1756 TaxID=2760311 RepID=UPI0016044B80